MRTAMLAFALIALGGAGAELRGAPAPIPEVRETCHSQPRDGCILSSEVSGDWRTLWADDFIFPEDRVITRIRWWGGYFSTRLPASRE